MSQFDAQLRKQQPREGAAEAPGWEVAALAEDTPADTGADRSAGAEADNPAFVRGGGCDRAERAAAGRIRSSEGVWGAGYAVKEDTVVAVRPGAEDLADGATDNARDRGEPKHRVLDPVRASHLESVCGAEGDGARDEQTDQEGDAEGTHGEIVVPARARSLGDRLDGGIRGMSGRAVDRGSGVLLENRHALNEAVPIGAQGGIRFSI